MVKHLGVIVGRFQTPELHEGHKALLKEVLPKTDTLFIALSSSANTPSKINPLPYKVREAMLYKQTENFKVQIEEILDCPSDDIWSERLDEMIDRMVSAAGQEDPTIEVMLYGGRDSFIPRYHGEYPTKELDLKVEASATAVRESIQLSHSKDFLKGMVYATQQLRPRIFPTVDIGITIKSGEGYAVLLGRKPNESDWRFPGGFVDPADKNFEWAAIRELREETNINLLGFHLDLIHQCKIQDWRYSDGHDSLITSFFHRNMEEMPTYEAGDDLKELKWFQVTSYTTSYVVKEHMELMKKLRSHLDKLIAGD